MRRFVATAFLATVVSIVLPLHGQASAPTESCSLHGRIADPLGAAIQRAFVPVHSDRWVQLDRRGTLTENGEFEIQLKPGLYDLFVGSRGFLPFTKEVDLRSCKPVSLKVKLLVDMEHLED